MLTGRLRRRGARLAAALALALPLAVFAAGAAPAAAAPPAAASAVTATSGPAPAAAKDATPVEAPPQDGTAQTQGAVGLTVSWSPTDKPVQAKVGGTTTGRFWVTNTTGTSIPVTVRPGIAVPGDNGRLSVHDGVDRRFSDITYTPSSFDAPPHGTVPVDVRVTIPGTLSPGVYLIPGIVQPHPPRQAGTINIEQEIIAPVTFQIPGHIRATMHASFIATLAGRGDGVSTAFPGLAAVQVAPTGAAVLRVRDRSSTSLYSYHEIVSTQFPGGTARFDDHTPHAPANLRSQPVLFFPGLYRDYPISWTPEPLGIGVAHLTAYVSFSPDPAVIKQTSVSADILVISPWWFLAVSAYLAMLLVRAGRRARAERRHGGRRSSRPRRRPHRGSAPARLAGALLLAAVTLCTALVSALPLFAAAAALGPAVALAGFLLLRRRAAARVARGRALSRAVTWLLVASGSAGLVAGALLPGRPFVGLGLALLAAAGVWLLTAAAWHAGRRHGGGVRRGRAPARPQAVPPHRGPQTPRPQTPRRVRSADNRLARPSR